MSKGRVLLGVVAAPHGVRGLVRIKSFTEDPMAIASYGVLSDGHRRIGTCRRRARVDGGRCGRRPRAPKLRAHIGPGSLHVAPIDSNTVLPGGCTSPLRHDTQSTTYRTADSIYERENDERQAHPQRFDVETSASPEQTPPRIRSVPRKNVWVPGDCIRSITTRPGCPVSLSSTSRSGPGFHRPGTGSRTRGRCLRARRDPWRARVRS